MIDFINVSKKYDGEEDYVFQDFNLHVDRGEIIVLTGASGIGKTTLTNLLLKDIEPTSGKILVDGKDIASISNGRLPYYRRQLGVVFQDYRLVPELTAYENVRLAMVGAGGWKKQTGIKRISSVFSMLGIASIHNKRPYEMSGGEQQKVSLARAIINYPKILVADEPTRNLDPAASREIFVLFNIINSQGITVIISTHDVELAEQMKWRRIELCESNGFTGNSNKKIRNEEDNHE